MDDEDNKLFRKQALKIERLLVKADNDLLQYILNFIIKEMSRREMRWKKH